MEIEPGTVIEATHTPEDLIPAFMDVLDVHNPERWSTLRSEYGFVLDAIEVRPYSPSGETKLREGMEQDASEFIEVLFDALGELAPEGYYFGAHPGDGADFGFSGDLEDDA